MRKKVWIAIVLCVLLPISYTSVAWWLGGKVAEQRRIFSAFLTKQPYLSVVNVVHHRGIFRSSTTTTLVLSKAFMARYSDSMGPEGPALQFTVHENIHHGPLTYDAEAGLRFSRAASRIQIVWPAAIARYIQIAYGKQEPLGLRTHIAWNGNGTLRLMNPGFKDIRWTPDVQLSWGGLQGLLHYNADYSRQRYHYWGPGLTAHFDENRRISLGQWKAVGDQTRAFDGFMLGDNQLQIATLQVGDGKQSTPHFALTGLVTKIQGTRQGDFVDFSLNTTVKGLERLHTRWGPLHLNMRLAHLHGPSLADLFNTTEEIQKKDLPFGQTQQLMESTFIRDGIPLLQKSPTFSIDRASIQVPEGEVQLKLQLKLDGFTGAELQQPATVLSKVDASIQLSIPEPVAYQLGNWALEKEAPGTPLQNRAKMTAQINRLMKTGWLRRQNNRLTADIVWQKGKLKMNGVDSTAFAYVP